MTKNKHLGPHFDDILREEGTLEATELAAIKMVIAEQVAKEMKKKKLSQGYFKGFFMIFISFFVTLLIFTQPLRCMENSIHNLAITTNITDALKQSPSFTNKLVETMEQRNMRISQLLENPKTSKRLKMEINELRENKKFVIDVHSVNSKTHPFEIRIAFYDDKTEQVLTCKMPQEYPFDIPILFIETKNELLNAKDLITIKDNLNTELRQIYSPVRRMNEIADMANAKIRSYEDEKIASQMVAEGYKRTLIHLQEKYRSDNVDLDGKYPEFQKKLNGLWVKEMPSGYFVFHVEGDYINIAFEPKFIKALPLLYHGSYAAGYHITKDNEFDIHINDVADLGKINKFQITVHAHSISIMFRSLERNSLLEPIISPLERDYVILEKVSI